MTDAYYRELGAGRYASLPSTEGPWGPHGQHGGPPTALLVHAMQRHAADPNSGDRSGPAPSLLRVTTEFVSPVPLADLAVDVRTVKDGRTTRLVEADLSADGRTVLRGRGWLVRCAELDGLAGLGDAAPPPLTTDAVSSPVGLDFPYAHSLEWRVSGGDPVGPGPAIVWARLKGAVVEGHEPTPVERVAAAADSGSGVSAVLDWARWSFVNIDLSIHLLRPPRGAWVCLDAATQVHRAGTGLAATTLYDADGRIGSAAQALLVAPR